MRRLIRVGSVCVLMLCACAEENGPPGIAGAWVDCNPENEERCELWELGWYFPPDGGPIIQLRKSLDGTYSCHQARYFENTTWAERDDGSVLIKGGVGIGTFVIERRGDLLDSVTDGVFHWYEGDVMTKIAGPDFCDD